MNYSIYRFTLDIHRTKSQVSIPVLFRDTGIQFYISLTDGGKPYFIEDGCRAVFSAKKPDGATLFNDCIIEDNTRIRYDFTEQTTNCEGMMNCEIRLYGKDGNLLTTPAFVVVVDPRVVYDSEVLDSFPEATSLDNILSAENERLVGEQQRVDAEAVRVIVENARAAAESERVAAENARVTAEGARGDAEAERIANEAERVAAYAHMIGSWVAYSLYEDGTDYTWTWSEGQRYIGICNGKTPPQDKTGFVWSKFVDTGIYIGSGEMPEWCDLQIDPDGEVTEIVQESGQSATNIMSQKAVSNTFSNALTGCASGEIVSLNDVSPVAHEMGVSVKGKNLLNPADYAGALYQTTLEGDVFTTNFEVNSLYLNAKKTVTHKAGTYTVTLVPVSSGMYCNIYIYSAAELSKLITSKTIQDKSEPVSLTFTADEGFALCISGRECGEDSGKVGAGVFSYKLMLEEGTTATAYAPYIADISSVKVKAMGKNLLPYPYVDVSKTSFGGLTVENNNGTITLSGDFTASVLQDYHLSSAMYLPVGRYVISGCPDADGSDSYRIMVEIKYADGRLGYFTDYGKDNGGKYFILPEGSFINAITIRVSPTWISGSTKVFKPQLEISDIATEYEPYKGLTNTQNEAITSIYPSMTLTTDTAGAIMDVTYNRDANKVLQEILSRLTAVETAVLN